MRTFKGVNMCGSRLWLAAVALQVLLVTANGKHHRRSMPTQATLPVSKSGWRPVLGSGGLLYGSYGNPALGGPSYKIPVPVLDLYPSSARPVSTRDATKLTSIAQSYRPTTLRTVSSAAPSPPSNQPINSYHNPFALPNNGITYKYVQNFPVDSVLIRNPQNPFAARPIFSKYPTKLNQAYHNSMLQQLTHVQPVYFGQYHNNKPVDVFGKPVESYVRPTDPVKQSHGGTEIYKTEVFKLPDSDTASQSVSQQVKTAQQQSFAATSKTPYSHFSFKDSVLPPSILGTFGSFGVQSVKGRDPIYSTTKTTHLSPQPTKQTIFNSFSYTPTYKTTPTFSSTTPKLQTTFNHLNFGSNFNDYKNIPTQQTKVSVPVKIDPNVGSKGSFKPSPQDPFIKNQNDVDNKPVITTYNPILSTTISSNYFDYNFPSHHNTPIQTKQEQPTFSYEKKKQKIHDSVAAGVNQSSQQYVSPPKKQTTNSVIPKPTYEVTETTASDDIITHSLPPAWTYDHLKSTEQPVTKPISHDIYIKQTTSAVPDLPEEYAIVTEAEKAYDNSLSYDGQVESQSRRPLGDDFEPIGKHKLKDYYYKVSTSSYDDYTTSRRTKKPTEASPVDVTTDFNIIKESSNEKPADALPTLPPNKHFKRPNQQEPLDKDKIRKRIKNRRRRPPVSNHHNKEETTSTTTTRKFVHSTTELPQTTEAEEVHTIRPRVRPLKSKPQPNLTTPSVTTDLTTSALPTLSPTIPTILKKKLARRPLTTTTERTETTTQLFKDYDNKDSSIMKITSRPQFPKITSAYDYKNADVPDYTHKQDEKDTPTSDVAVSLSDAALHSTPEAANSFAFHKDVKPIEAIDIRDTTTDSTRITTDISYETTTNRPEASENSGRVQRPRLKNRFNRPKFSVKDYRNRLNSTTSTTEKSLDSTTKVRFPQRKVPNNDNYFNSEVEVTTERKKFIPKDPRHKINNTEFNEETEKEIHSYRQPARQKQTGDTTEAASQKISSRIRNGLRRPKPTEETTESVSSTVVHKRPLRKKIKDSDTGESVQDVSVTETTVHYDQKNDITSERTRSESAIMKIADKKHQDHHLEHLFEHSKRVSDLTLAASKDYNTPGMFKTVSSNSRRIPNYFTIATDDPILPIEAFFPQLNQKKES
ncbi:uncharacterized protein LOC113521810 [Galleria mellonella]|uniref:Uncharacterized protein LOC113521810 n=1 Tax=Galleria mellonella TaxID=7137 RepID=A0A6J3C247_GALME|nr:uncharacterized protein LOC113521810 [Galleria mellonella]